MKIDNVYCGFMKPTMNKTEVNPSEIDMTPLIGYPYNTVFHFLKHRGYKITAKPLQTIDDYFPPSGRYDPTRVAILYHKDEHRVFGVSVG